MAKTSYPKESKETVIGRLWLLYFNQTLYDKGLISERERNRMAVQIKSWKGIKTSKGTP